MTAENASDSQSHSFQGAVAFECFERVRGTCRIVTTACWKQRRDAELVAADQKYENLAHQSAFDPRHPFTDYANVISKLLKRRPVGFGLRPNQQVHIGETR